MLIDIGLPQNFATGLTFAQLANVQTVGIGLYLALAVIQVLSTTGVAGLSRRVAALSAAVKTVNSIKMRSEKSNVNRLAGDLSGLEIGFHDLNRRLLFLVAVPFLISIIYFVYCTSYQDYSAGSDGAVFIFIFYIGLPIAIFLFSMLVIRHKCRKLENRVTEAEKK